MAKRKRTDHGRPSPPPHARNRRKNCRSDFGALALPRDELFELELDDRFELELDDRFELEFEELFELEFDERFELELDDLFELELEDRFELELEERFELEFDELLPAKRIGSSPFCCAASGCSTPLPTGG